MLLRQNPNECGYPTGDGPAENEINGENRGEAFGATNYGDDGREKIKT
jgi:hypothetical protein